MQREDRTERKVTGNRNVVIQDTQKKHSRNWWMGGPECIQITLATLFHSDSVHGHQRHLLTLQGHQGNCNMAFKDHCISLGRSYIKLLFTCITLRPKWGERNIKLCNPLLLREKPCRWHQTLVVGIFPRSNYLCAFWVVIMGQTKARPIQQTFIECMKCPRHCFRALATAKMNHPWSLSPPDRKSVVEG